uniref:Uncharacterized protein n=1 Tax=Anguilla anguilla TaxID=7936 RepID=A0A0E9TQY0_ANGAN
MHSRFFFHLHFSLLWSVV